MLLDVREVASFADYFVIASARNERHMRALVDILVRELRQDGVRARHQEGCARAVCGIICRAERNH